MEQTQANQRSIGDAQTGLKLACCIYNGLILLLRRHAGQVFDDNRWFGAWRDHLLCPTVFPMFETQTQGVVVR